jgi:hypothetical protein
MAMPFKTNPNQGSLLHSSCLLCLLLLTPLFQGSMLLGEEADCKDLLRTEVPVLAEGRIEKLSGAREFLWRHWTDKKCGELFLTTWSKEGVRTDSHYRIEMTHPNATMLTVTLSRRDDPTAAVYALAVPSSGRIERTPPETTSYRAYIIERVKPEVPYFVEKAKLIPKDKVVPPSKYRLRFRGEDGKVITDF